MAQVGLLCDVGACNQFPEYPGLESEYVAFLSSSNKTDAPEFQVGSYLSQEIQKAREHIRSTLDKSALSRTLDTTRIDDLEKTVKALVDRISSLELQINKISDLDANLVIKPTNGTSSKPTDNGDAESDLFASDSEDDEEAERVKAQRIKEYESKKAKKPTVIAKSNIIFDVKPWGDDTDLEEMERLVRKIETDGLLWGSSKLVPLAYGIRKLQICCVVEDDKVSVDFLEEAMTELEDHVQSVDVAAFNKV